VAAPPEKGVLVKVPLQRRGANYPILVVNAVGFAESSSQRAEVDDLVATVFCLMFLRGELKWHCQRREQRNCSK